jgi:hypothetical protein
MLGRIRRRRLHLLLPLLPQHEHQMGLLRARAPLLCVVLLPPLLFLSRWAGSSYPHRPSRVRNRLQRSLFWLLNHSLPQFWRQSWRLNSARRMTATAPCA